MLFSNYKATACLFLLLLGLLEKQYTIKAKLEWTPSYFTIYHQSAHLILSYLFLFCRDQGLKLPIFISLLCNYYVI